MIDGIPGVRGAQAYLYRGLEGMVVIDPGYTGSVPAILRFLHERALDSSSIDWVILTHHHIDHAGTAWALCQATGARLAVHIEDARYLRRGRPRELTTLWGMADHLPQPLARYIVSCADGDLRRLEDGETIAGLTVVHTPGHTPGSICLWSESESVLFTGDALNNERGLHTPPWSVNFSHRMAVQAPTRLKGLRYAKAYFGHGPAILDRADAQVEAYLDGRPSRSRLFSRRASSAVRPGPRRT